MMSQTKILGAEVSGENLYLLNTLFEVAESLNDKALKHRLESLHNIIYKDSTYLYNRGDANNALRKILMTDLKVAKLHILLKTKDDIRELLNMLREV
jgi:hypothetical protein